MAVADYARANNKGGARAVKSNIGTAGCALVVKASVITVPLAGSGVAPRVYAAAGIQQANASSLKHHQNGVCTVLSV